MASPLSALAKEFYPTAPSASDHQPLRSSLSVDVPEFIPKVEKSEESAPKTPKEKQKDEGQVSSEATKEDEKAIRNDTKTKDEEDLKVPTERPKSYSGHRRVKTVYSKKDVSKEFNPRHDHGWASDTVDVTNAKIQSFSPRHDQNWFYRDEGSTKKDLRKSDSYHISLSHQRSQHTKTEQRQLVQTFSLGHSKQEKSLQKKVNDEVAKDTKSQQDTNYSLPKLSWSAIVKTPGVPKAKLEPKQSINKSRHKQLQKQEEEHSPNTGHKQDFRTKSYDVERDKRAKQNKLKRTSSLLSTIDQAHEKTLAKKLGHQLLTESRSLGPYDMLKSKPKLNIERKSLVLKAKLSAGMNNDPKMNNWFNKELTQELLKQQNLHEEKTSNGGVVGEVSKKPEGNFNHVKRKLTRTTKQVYLPSSNVMGFTASGLSRSTLNDDYFSNDKYDIDKKKFDKGINEETEKIEDKENNVATDNETTGTTITSLNNVTPKATTSTTKTPIPSTTSTVSIGSQNYNVIRTVSPPAIITKTVVSNTSSTNALRENRKLTKTHNIITKASTITPKPVKPGLLANENNEQPTANSTGGILSYSAILKKKASAPVSSVKSVEKEIEEDKPSYTSEEIRLYKKAKKKEKKKMKKLRKIEERVTQQCDITSQQRSTKTNQSAVKPSQKEISLDISEMFNKLLSVQPAKQSGAKKQRQKKLVVSTGVVSVVSGLAKKNTTDGKKTARNKYGGTGVIMDGATPIVKRGKERQTPKKKKPTLLKKIIKAERERRQLEKARQDENSKDTEKDVPDNQEQPQQQGSHQQTETEKIEKAIGESTETSEEIIENECTPDERQVAREHAYGAGNTNNSKKNSTTTPSIKQTKSTKTTSGTVTVQPTATQQATVSIKAPLTELPEEISKQLHSRKFREYCNHVLKKEINDLTYQLLITLQRFQDRIYHENPAKFKQKRRFVLGLREVLKHTKLKHIKCVVIAPNLERISSEGGLDDYLRNIMSLCEEMDIPKVFAMNRHALGKTLKKKAPVSVVGIFNYDGAQDTFKELISEVKNAQAAYQEIVRNLMNDTQQQNQYTGRSAENTQQDNSVKSNFIHPATLKGGQAEQLKERILNNLTREECVGNTS